MAAAACGKKDAGSTATTPPEAAAPGAASVASAPAAPTLPRAARRRAAPPPDATTTASGLASKVLQPGTGTDHPSPTDKVKVHYTGWTKSGQMFDSSVLRGQPITFALNGVIPGWTEGVGLMVVGEKRRLWIPAKMAYGDHPRMGAPAGDLVFDVELLDIVTRAQAASRPDGREGSARRAPRRRRPGSRTACSRPGTGTAHPTPASNVTVHYSGWTTDGKMFDSSVVRGEPVTFRLDTVIKGWAEGVQLMTKGEKARFWIPGALWPTATRRRGPGRPPGCSSSISSCSTSSRANLAGMSMARGPVRGAASGLCSSLRSPPSRGYLSG